MLTYSAMYRPAMQRLVESVVSMNVALADMFLSLSNDWIRAQGQLGKRLTPPPPAPAPDKAKALPAPDSAAPAAPAPEAVAAAAETGPDQHDSIEAEGADEMAPPGADGGNDAAPDEPVEPGGDIEEVHDDVSDDIAHEIAREVAEEAAAAAPALADDKPAAVSSDDISR